MASQSVCAQWCAFVGTHGAQGASEASAKTNGVFVQGVQKRQKTKSEKQIGMFLQTSTLLRYLLSVKKMCTTLGISKTCESKNIKSM